MTLRAPVFGPLVRKLSLAKFTRTFGTLVAAGVPILTALDIVADTSGNEVIAQAVKKSRAAIMDGGLPDESERPLARPCGSTHACLEERLCETELPDRFQFGFGAAAGFGLAAGFAAAGLRAGGRLAPSGGQRT